MGVNTYAEETIQQLLGPTQGDCWIVESEQWFGRSTVATQIRGVFATKGSAETYLQRLKDRWQASQRLEADLNRRYVEEGTPWPDTERDRPLPKVTFTVKRAPWVGG